MGQQNSVPLTKDLLNQSKDVTDAKQVEGEGVPRVTNITSGLAEWSKTDTGYENKEMKTIWDLYQRGVQGYPKRKLYGTRLTKVGDDGKVTRGEYVHETYEEIDAKVVAIGRALVSRGLKAGAHCGIFANNRVEWCTTAFALYSQSMQVVSLYSTLGAEAVDYIMNHGELEVLFLSPDELPMVMANLKAAKAKKEEGKEEVLESKIKLLVIYDHQEKYGNKQEKVEEKDVEAAAAYGVTLVGFSALLKEGEEKKEIEVNPPQPDDMAFLMYTSGTTGVPKGAMLSHGNITTACTSNPLATSEDRYLSYLPLAHIYESVVQYCCISVGAHIWFFQGNIRKLADDIKSCEPTIFGGVPRVYQKFYDKIFGGLGSVGFIKRTVFMIAYNKQKELLHKRLPRSQKWDNKVFIPLRSDKLGLGKCRLAITGAAPCPAYLFDFIRIVIGAEVLQGYGMTENSACCTLMVPSDGRGGHVGPPGKGVEIKLVDVPDMNYTSADKPCPRGEVVCRGDMVFKGYFKNEEETNKALKDGWLYTGDIGRWNEDGTLSIIDRKKNIFKLSQGEYIAVEKVEEAYGTSEAVGQMWVFGNSYKPFVVAVVVPEAAWLEKFAKAKGWFKTEAEAPSEEHRKALSEICKDKDRLAAVKEAIFATFRKCEADAKLAGFEKVKGIIIEGEYNNEYAGFHVENDLTTPTFKLKRPALKDKYLAQLKQLYTDLDDPPKESENW